ncbi:MAG: hypothetical protein FWF31_11820, partial [Desulfobulbus sp.]|nr:hypothetical protein [Desulfobulbus sp.]
MTATNEGVDFPPPPQVRPCIFCNGLVMWPRAQCPPCFQRQVGLALIVSRDTRLPLFYREYEGSRHDSKLFSEVIDDVFQSMASAVGNQTNMTVVFDKGMNGGEHIAAIDSWSAINFITTCSTRYSEDLIHVSLDKFAPVDIEHNKQLPDSDRLLAWRIKGEYWGQERTVVVAYNPFTA